ncbi:hypothetical protein Trydic_g20580 [Trypoxylus dichotomus]
MYFALKLLSLLVAFSGICAVDLFGAIIRGTPAKIINYPYHAFLLNKANGTLRCGGAIIKTNMILTAAHCLFDKDFYVYTGIQSFEDLHNSQPHRVEDVIKYPRYRGQTGYDIGLVILSSHIRLGPTAKVIPLMQTRPKIGSTVLVIGFGKVECKHGRWYGAIFLCDGDRSHILRSAKLKVKGTRRGVIYTLDDDRNTCYGDSGSPIVYKKNVVGVVSSGQYANCTGYDTHAAVAPHYYWIEKYLEEY